jgi:hypothetical protein
MAADQSAGNEKEVGRFGSCCSELQEALDGQDFEPLITVGTDGILYVSVGLIEVEGEEPGLVDHPLFFCPFCGSKLQDAAEVKAKVEQAGISDSGDEA